MKRSVFSKWPPSMLVSVKPRYDHAAGMKPNNQRCSITKRFQMQKIYLLRLLGYACLLVGLSCQDVNSSTLKDTVESPLAVTSRSAAGTKNQSQPAAVDLVVVVNGKQLKTQ